jgi:hypothetical protein
MNFLRHLQNSRLMNEMNEDGVDGGGAAESNPESFSKDQLDEAVAKAVEAATNKMKQDWDADVQGLKKNRDDLKNEKLDLQKKMKDNELNQRLLDADERDLEKIRTEITESIKSQYEEQLTSTKTELDNLKDSLNTKTIHAALDAKLNDLKVKSSLRNALKAEILLENKPVVLDDKVVLGETSLDDFFTEWQKSDRSKDFIVASRNSGGGSTGAGGQGHSSEIDLLQLGGADMFGEAFRQQASLNK